MGVEVSFTDEKSTFTGSLTGYLLSMTLAWADIYPIFFGDSLHISTRAVCITMFYFINYKPIDNVVNYSLIWMKKIRA